MAVTPFGAYTPPSPKWRGELPPAEELRISVSAAKLYATPLKPGSTGSVEAGWEGSCPEPRIERVGSTTVEVSMQAHRGLLSLKPCRWAWLVVRYPQPRELRVAVSAAVLSGVLQAERVVLNLNAAKLEGLVVRASRFELSGVAVTGSLESTASRLEVRLSSSSLTVKSSVDLKPVRVSSAVGSVEVDCGGSGGGELIASVAASKLRVVCSTGGGSGGG